VERSHARADGMNGSQIRLFSLMQQTRPTQRIDWLSVSPCWITIDLIFF
jgi:hypothetical protein